MNIRPASGDDVAAIAAIEQCVQGEHAWSYAQLDAALTEERTVVLVAENKDGIAGYALSQYVLDEAELHIIGVHPDFQRQGIARKLLDGLVRVLMQHDVVQLFLEVRASNEPAIKLYQSHGFAQVGIRKNYYKKQDTREFEREDAHIMQRVLISP